MHTKQEILIYGRMASEAYDLRNATINDGYIYAAPEVTGTPANVGFSASSYFNPLSGELVVAFGGTEDLFDLSTDISLAIADATSQQVFALAYVETARLAVAALGMTIQSTTYVGHSLGGFLAQEALLNDADAEVSAVVFNSTGHPDGPRTDENVTYYYTSPVHWEWITARTHELDDRLSDDVHFVLDETGQYPDVLDGHFIDPLLDAIQNDQEIVSRAQLVTLVTTALNDAYSEIGTNPAAIAQTVDSFGRLPKAMLVEAAEASMLNDSCFPAGTPIRLWDGTTKPIEEITPSDTVVSFNAAGELVPGQVTQLLHNVTTEWLKLSTGTVVTPGHRFLRPDGSFAEIADILAGDGRIVAEDGVVMTVTAERIVYSADTAHLFEEAEKMAYGTDGGAALAPEAAKGWRTYNFTVAEHHTYIADGIRVHNDSVLATLEDGDKLIALNADLTNAAVLRDVNGDGTLDFVTLDGYQRAGQPTEIALERVYYWNAASGDLETLIANELANAPNAAAHVFDPGAGNNWNDGTFGDDIEEVFFDDVVGASGSGTDRAVVDGLYSATLFRGVNVSSLASAGEIVASQALIDAINAASTNSNDALGIAAWLLGIEVGSLAYLAMVALLEDDLTGPPPDGIVQGTSGNDLIDSSFTDSDGDSPGTGADTIEGLGGADTIFGGAGQDVIYGHNGDDMLHGGGQADTIRGGNGNDIVWGDNGQDTVYLGNGNDVFHDNSQSDSNGADTVFGHAGDDTINGSGGNDVFWGGAGLDTIYGGIGDDEIHGGADDDIISAGDGNDIVWGDQGRDTVDLGDGDDVFHDDNPSGGQDSHLERDTVHGGSGNDTINGGEGNDTFYGEAGNDTISGGSNDDAIYGGNDDDVLDGENGQDALFGGNGNDQVRGGDGRDEVRGGAGDDVLDGGTGLDMLYGGGGNDTLHGGAGGDTLTGGGGADIFIFIGNFHKDVITDFDPNRAGEKIDLSGVAEITGYTDLTANHLSQQGTSMVITVNPSNTITLEDVSSLSANDFIF